jgi:hypothetical protein
MRRRRVFILTSQGCDMASTDFRVRVKNIRSDARALIVRLREERLAKSRFARKAEDTAMPVIMALQPSPVLTLQSETIVPSRRFRTKSAVAMQENTPAPVLSGDKSADLATTVLSVDAVTAIEPLRAKNKKAKSESWKKKFVPVPETLPESDPPNVGTALPDIAAEPVVNYEKTIADQVLPALNVMAVTIADRKNADRRSRRTKPVKASPAIDATQSEHTVVNKKKVVIGKSAKKLPASSALTPAKKLCVTDHLGITPAEPWEPADEPVRQQALVPIKTITRRPEGLASLSNVPTLGPGMIWRLNQLGLETLHDLADVEAGQLRAALGPVGKLVKIEDWIHYARQVASA